MKNVFKLLLISLVSVLAVCCMFACNAGGAGSGGAPVELPEKIDVDAGSYEKPVNNAYGAEPDIDVVVDGFLDDQFWQNENLKWYTHYAATPRIKYEMTAVTTKDGLCIAFRSYDPIVTWHGYNYFYRNTNVRFDISSSLAGGSDVTLMFDANNIRPLEFFVNGRSQYYGQLNAAGKGDGISVEVFVRWEDLNVDTSEGSPEEIKILPLYYYCATPIASSTTVMYPMFVKTTGNANQAATFDKNGYVDGDEEGATVGSHDSGMAKTNGWTVEKDESGAETATSSAEATRGFPQVIFFKNTKVSSNFKVTTDITIGNGSTDARAGIIMYKDSINYRAVALQYNSKNLSDSGKLSTYNLRGYTNYPANITMVKDMYNKTALDAFDTVTLTVYNNGGSLYYVLNGEYVYSELASYVATNNYIGLYAFDTTTKFSNYKCETFDSEEDLLDDFRKYAYTVSTFDYNPEEVTAEIDQIAVNKEGGSVGVTLTFSEGYTLDDVGYIINGEREEHSVMDQIDVKSGSFRLEITGNVSIYTKAKKIDENDLIDMTLYLFDEDSGESLYGLNAVIIGSGSFTRYNIRFEYGGTKVKVPSGYSWSYIVSGTGYKECSGEILDGEVYDGTNQGMASLYIKSLMLGGTAMSALGEDGNPVTSFSKMSVPASTWDISNAENGQAIFQTSRTDAGEVYFSGRTVSDYQVAYVEITNRTDPSAFTSLENDPAAGFLIASENTTTYVGLRVTGLRIIPNRSDFSTRTDVSGITGWNGHLPTVDRENGGRFISSSIGRGTVNRIPNDETEYTTSFMLIRKGGYTYVYAADGKVNVGKDKSNFDKMKLIYSFYNQGTNSFAAIGFGVTVAFNLRMDFENYWILSGAAAAEFADSEIGTSIVVNNHENISLSGDGLLNYNQESGRGNIVKGSSIKFKLNDQGGADKIVKATISTGEVYYLYANGESFTHTFSSAANPRVTFEEIEALTISGKVIPPDNVASRVFNGHLYDLDGNKISSVRTASDGRFSLKIEKDSGFKIAFEYDGYAMAPVTIPENGQVGELKFIEIPIGGMITRQDGTTASSVAGAVYGYTEQDGVYFEYQHENAGSDGVYIKSSNLTEDMVIDFTYSRKAKPATASGSEDKDASMGLVFFGPSGSYGMRFIGTGYRIMLNDNYNQSTNINVNGVSNINMALTSTPEDYNMRFIKLGSVVYMCCKPASQDKYDVITAFDTMPHVGDKLTDVYFSWCSYGWTSIKISNIEINDATGKSLGDYVDQINTATLAVSGAEYVSIAGKAVVSYDDSTATGKIIKGAELEITATDVPQGYMLKIEVGDTVAYASAGETAVVNTLTKDSTLIKITQINGMSVRGKVAYPTGVSSKKLNGAVRDASGNKFMDVTTDASGNFEVFVETGNQYYVSFYLDGYVMTPALIEGADLGTLTFNEGILSQTITKVDGTVGSDTTHPHDVYLRADGSLCIDMMDASAYDGGIYLKMDAVKTDMVISMTYERHAKPETVTTGQDTDTSFGLIFGGTTGKYGVRFIGTGYRIMRNDVYNSSTNVEARNVSPVNFAALSTSEPINVKYIKVGSTVYMCVKAASQESYTVIYTFNLMGANYSIGSELNDIQISWVSHGWYSITVSDIKIEDVSASNASEVYREFTLENGEGGEVYVGGEKITGTKVDGYRGSNMKIKIVPDAGKIVSKLVVAGEVVDLSGYNGGELEYVHNVVSGGPIVVEYDVAIVEKVIEITNAEKRGVKAIVATMGDTTVNLSKSEDKSKLSDSVAYLDTVNATITVKLPVGEWKITLYSDEDKTTKLGEYTVSVT